MFLLIPENGRIDAAVILFSKQVQAQEHKICKESIAKLRTVIACPDHLRLPIPNHLDLEPELDISEFTGFAVGRITGDERICCTPPNILCANPDEPCANPDEIL